MKIKEFSIIRYGPLPNTGKIFLHNFNLFFGKNEDGKTLTIDALVKLLLRTNIRVFEKIDRVEENPEGYVIIEDDQGKEIKIPEKGNLTKVADLSSSECRNIFIIRNSDLSIPRESEFYTNVTDRLTGLRTKDISKIKDILIEIGKITPTGGFREIKGENLKTRVNEALGLIEKINVLEEKIKKEKFDELEEESVRQREDIEKVEGEIKSLEDARKREEYEKGKEALDSLKKALDKFKDLGIYNENDKQLWRDSEKDIKTFTEEKEKLSTELDKKEEEYKKVSEELGEKEIDFQVFVDRKKKLDDEIKPELKNYEIKSGELAQQKGKEKIFSLIGIISPIILGICLIGVILSISLLRVIFSPSLLLFSILAGLFFISTIGSWILRLLFSIGKDRLAGTFEKIRLTLSKFELRADTIEGILSNIQRFGDEYEKKEAKLQEIRGKKEKLEEKIKELRDEIPKIENKIKEAEGNIDKIRSRSREESLEEYTKKLKLKQNLEKSIGEQKGILRSRLEEKSEKEEENILYWDEEITKLGEYKDKAKDIKYSETRESELEEKKQKLDEKLKELKDSMKAIQKEMEELERKVNEILRLEGEYLYCKTSVDLKAVKDKLQRFIDENENNKDNVLEVMKIFEEIEAEEKEKVSKLFGKESPISKYFDEITEGLYEEVSFNQNTGNIKVKRRDGKILRAEKLSGGAYDQLYFSIRLALGEKLLKDKKGFFIMDDPFVKADPDRLKRQIQTLKKISKLGWQVLYFSAKGEIYDVFKGDIDRGAINYIEHKGIFS